MSESSQLIALGLSHRSAPVALRERLAIPAQDVPRHLAALRRGTSSEALILSTCNRVEIYAVVRAETGPDALKRYLSTEYGVGGRELDGHTYGYRGGDAIQHLFRVASSLDSLVVGEPQILGQVKSAFSIAEESRAVGPVLQPLMRRTLTVAKRVRTETGIGRDHVSVGHAGVELAGLLFGRLEGRRAVLVGTGEMGRLVAKALLDAGVAELVVVNRTYERAVELAADFGGTAAHMDQLQSYLERVDIGVVSTGSQRHLLTRDQLRAVMRSRRARPLFLVDLSVPRNVDPAAHDLEGCYVFNVDDLAEIALRGEGKRAGEARRAEIIVEEEAARATVRMAARSSGQIIGAMAKRAEAARSVEIARSQAVLAELTPKQRKKVEAMTRSMFKRFLHGPIQHVRTAGEVQDEETVRVLAETFLAGEEDV